MTIDKEWTPPQGVPAREALGQSVARSEAAMRMVKDLADRIERTEDAVGRCEFKLDQVIADVGKLQRRTTPPPKSAELTGSFDVRGLVYQAVAAYQEGERNKNKDPETEVERVIERVENIRMGRRVRAIIGKVAIAVGAAGGGWALHVIWEAIKAGVK